jgi:hypothetical protein
MDTHKEPCCTEVIGAKKYIVLTDGRMARLLKPVKVKNYLYYSFRNDEGKTVRINLDNLPSTK